MQRQEQLALLIAMTLSLLFSVSFASGSTSLSSSSTTSVPISNSTSLSTSISSSSSLSTTSVAPLSLVSVYVSNSQPMQGQSETLTATISGGVPPYLYAFIARNSLNSGRVAAGNASSALDNYSFPFLLPVSANDTGMIRINVSIADSANSVVNGWNSITVSPQQVSSSTSTVSQSSSTTAAATSYSTTVSTTLSTSVTTTVAQAFNDSEVYSLVSSYGSNVITNASSAQFNSTTALNLGQLNQITPKLLAIGANINHLQANVSYGSLAQGGRVIGAGKTFYYIAYNGNGSVAEYTVNVNKKVPDLHVRIGNFTSNSTMGNVTLLQSSYSRIGNKLYPQSTYSINPQLFSAVQGNNTLNYTYSIYVGGNLKAFGSSSGSSISKGFSFGSIPINQPTKIVFDAQGNSNYSSIDPTVYVFFSSGNAAVTISTATTLTGDLVCGTLTVNSGQTLTTAGYSILCNSTITNSGTISSGGTTNNPANGGPTGTVGGSASSSYGGSGGGGGGYNNVGGNGGTPTSPTVNNANIQTWYGTGGLAIQTYFEGAGGGGSADVAGGSGSYGVYMQASKVVEGTVTATGVAGTVDTGTTKTAGQNGGSTSGTAGGTGGAASGHGAGTSACGGGGGGAIILAAYGSGGFTTGTTTVTGGSGTGCTETGGTGGSGRPLSFSYGTSAPIVVLAQLKISPATIGSAILDVGQSYTFSTTASNGLAPYTGNWQWIAPNTVSPTNTINAALPTATNALALTINPKSNTDLGYTWSSVNYDLVPSGGADIEGVWAFNGFVVDNGLDQSAANTVNTANTPVISINSMPAATLSPSSGTIASGQVETYTITVNGGTGKYTAELYNVTGAKQACADGQSAPCNVIIFTPGGTNTIAFTAGTSAGSFTYNTIVTDQGTTNPFTFNSVSSTITVSTATCQPIVSNSLVNFGTVVPGSFAPTANAVNIKDSGTSAANVVLYSVSTTTGNWVYLSNSFLTSNTVWDGSLHASSISGNQLTNSITTDTKINVATSGSGNTLYFGVNVPKGQQPGTYTQGVTVTFSC
ncbi:MAG: hypothetical protein KGI04_04475 [Candidatus Micrarchaeota archaeon]|nr:hypothetical protein [Candidatus Micrarchaeota archaeon]